MQSSASMRCCSSHASIASGSWRASLRDDAQAVAVEQLDDLLDGGVEVQRRVDADAQAAAAARVDVRAPAPGAGGRTERCCTITPLGVPVEPDV